ncbi:protein DETOXIFICATION 15-like [Nicotiana tabacum]|uniref:Protein DETOXIFICATION 15-like n=1 Tax=Nicotiana tabacum TaxID=4097 RepID=A0A1S4CB46_TOBAC|nr:PREDICTED: protein DETOXIFICATION 15-like [Nicotiana tabacum]
MVESNITCLVFICKGKCLLIFWSAYLLPVFGHILVILRQDPEIAAEAGNYARFIIPSIFAYSNEEEVVTYAGKMLFFIAGSHFLNAHQSVFSGISKGCGWQKKGEFIYLGAYYLWGIPAGMVLAFVFHLGGTAMKAADRVTQEST